MRQLAASIAASLALAEDRAAADRRRADDWRELHRRPDALPEPVEPVRSYRRFRVTGFSVRRRQPATGEG